MGSKSRIVTRERVSIVGDALLITSAAYGLLIGLSALLIAPEGTPRPGTELAAAVSSITSLLVVVIAPLLVWVAHGRKLSLAAVFGALLGSFCTGFVFMAFAALAALVGLVISPFVESDFAGPLVVLGVVCLGYVLVVVWLLADTIRDLGSRHRRHPGIDAARLVSTAVLVAVAAGSVWWVVQHPGDESWELVVFAMVAGIGAAMALIGALVLTSVTAAQPRGRRDLGMSSPPTAPTRGG